MSKSTSQAPPAIVTKAYDFALWLLPKVEKFPRSYRFTVGDRLSSQGLDLLVLLVEAAYATDKQTLLGEANRKINSTRYLLRLAKDLRLLSMDFRLIDGMDPAWWGFRLTQVDGFQPAERLCRPMCGMAPPFRTSTGYAFWGCAPASGTT